MNLGAGRVVFQELQRINLGLEDGTLRGNPVLQQAFEVALRDSRTFHIMGLVSEGGVHSHSAHIKGLVDMAIAAGISELMVHAFTDGRDSDPHQGVGYVQQLQDHLHEGPGRLATLTGRYYAMDRDHRYDRIKLAYDAMVLGKGETTTDLVGALKGSYQRGVSDEFVSPMVATSQDGTPVGRIKEGDVVLCANFRSDRVRQITSALTQEDLPAFGMSRLNLHYVTMTRYDEKFRGIHVLLDKENLKNTLGEVLSREGKVQLRIAESEKYPHVTYFFSGGREQPFEGEHRIVCPSPKVATYDLQPEMSASDILGRVTDSMKSLHPDFICLNFANPDMVGHTGVMEAVVKACETVDRCLEGVVTCGFSCGYQSLIIADHGNAERMKNPDGTPHTAHTTNLVPCIYAYPATAGSAPKLKPGRLCDVAPTLLSMLDIAAPREMTGKVLFAQG